MLWFNESPEQLLEKALNMKSLNMDQVADMSTNSCRDDVCYAEKVNNSMYRINIQRNTTAEKEYCTSKSIKELISLIEEAVKT